VSWRHDETGLLGAYLRRIDRYLPLNQACSATRDRRVVQRGRVTVVRPGSYRY